MQSFRSALRVASRTSALRTCQPCGSWQPADLANAPAAQTGIRAFANLALKAPRSPPPDQSFRPHKDATDESHTSKWLVRNFYPLALVFCA
eukprot:1178695-Prorocentrum_minimum.AAC.3